MITEFLKTATESEMMAAFAASGVVSVRARRRSSSLADSTPSAVVDLSQIEDNMADSREISGVVAQQPTTAYSTPDAYIDIIGDIDGAVGFHANIMCVNVSDAQRSVLPFIAAPATPQRLFA